MDPAKRLRAEAAAILIRRGYRPAGGNRADEITLRLIEDMREFSSGRKQKATLELSGREITVLELAAAGYTRDEIAELTGVSSETIKTLQERARRKLGARNMTHAVHLADQQGLLEAA